MLQFKGNGVGNFIVTNKFGAELFETSNSRSPTWIFTSYDSAQNLWLPYSTAKTLIASEFWFGNNVGRRERRREMCRQGVGEAALSPLRNGKQPPIKTRFIDARCLCYTQLFVCDFHHKAHCDFIHSKIFLTNIHPNLFVSSWILTISKLKPTPYQHEFDQCKITNWKSVKFSVLVSLCWNLGCMNLVI